MTRIAQARPKRLYALIIGSAAMLLLAPSAAWAGSGHYNHDRHRTGSHYESHFDQARDHHAFRERQHHRGKWRGHEKHPVGYYCRSCNHDFSARDAFYAHVAYRHHVPFRHLAATVRFGAFSWTFFD